jgi:dTDP-glucose pyrophosphorylase
MAGRGSRFAAAGYTFPKPLIEVGPAVAPKPMIQVVVENLGLRGRWWFFCQQEHVKAYSLGTLLRLITHPLGAAEIVTTPEVTKGQADSVRLVLEAMAAKGDVKQPEPGSVVEWTDPVIVANSDQFLDGWHPGSFMDFIRREDPDGAVLTFHGSHPKWSFCEVEPEGNAVLRVAEKDPISQRACVGVFYFKTVAMLHDRLRSMMSDPSKMVGGEWYLAPVYNEMIEAGLRVIEFPVPRMLGLGTPEDFQRFERLVEAGKVRV